MNRKNKEHLGTVLALDEIQEEKKDEKEILVKTKVIEVELMDLDQAITNMTMLGHDFYIYKDSENENIAVVYNRKNGGYGLIEVE
jgi:putative sigma-54 modulation protein